MNNTVLTVTCALLILASVCSLDGNETSTCPSFNFFFYYMLRQCPASVSSDLRCVIELPSDIRISGHLNCRTSLLFCMLTLGIVE